MGSSSASGWGRLEQSDWDENSHRPEFPWDSCGLLREQNFRQAGGHTGDFGGGEVGKQNDSGVSFRVAGEHGGEARETSLVGVLESALVAGDEPAIPVARVVYRGGDMRGKDALTPSGVQKLVGV